MVTAWLRLGGGAIRPLRAKRFDNAAPFRAVLPPTAAFGLVPIFLMFPNVVQTQFQSPGIPDVELLQRVRILKVSRPFGVLGDALEMRGIVFIHHDYALAGVAVNSPVPVVLMKADGRRQTVLWSEIVNRASLPVIAGLDGGLGLHVGRQAVIHAGHFGDHGFPAKLVGIVLRQWRARVTVLADGRREMNGPRKSNELCGADH